MSLMVKERDFSERELWDLASNERQKRKWYMTSEKKRTQSMEKCNFLPRSSHQGHVSRNPRYLSWPGKYFFELIYLSANKKLLDEVFAISGITKVEVTVISRSLRRRLITVTDNSIISDIAKTESNNCFSIRCFTGKQNNGKQLQHLCPSCLPASERFFP